MSIFLEILGRITSYGPRIDQSHGENRLSHIINLFTACSSCSDSEWRGKEESRGTRTEQKKKKRRGERFLHPVSPPYLLSVLFPTRFTSRRPDYLKTWNRLITKGLPFLSEMIQRNPSPNLIRLLRVVITPSVTGLLRGEKDLK